jgi:hypothetical protein
MKTMKFRLLATIITLAAVITASTTNAQRRSTSDSKKVENTRTANKSNIEKKNTFRDDVKVSQSVIRSAKSNSDVKRNNPSASKEMKKAVSRTADNFRENKNNRTSSQAYSNKSNQNRTKSYEKDNNQSNYDNRERNSNSNKAIANAAEMPRRSTGYSTDNNRNNTKESYSSNRAATSGNSERYNLNTSDTRYKPNREYKGSDKYWSSDFRKEYSNNIQHNGNYNYSSYRHWDRNWEGYRWNHNSWRNYYSFYNPYSYRNHKYYYHHPYYGHVIRRFVYRPAIYIHNHTRYYCYDGNFFRYRSGVGYVLVDIPFGFAFEYLPSDYERVYINGYLYFRIGNLFFESTNYGFLLVHYPERYYAYNDGYSSEGFHFSDMNF